MFPGGGSFYVFYNGLGRGTAYSGFHTCGHMFIGKPGEKVLELSNAEEGTERQCDSPMVEEWVSV